MCHHTQPHQVGLVEQDGVGQCHLLHSLTHTLGISLSLIKVAGHMLGINLQQK